MTLCTLESDSLSRRGLLLASLLRSALDDDWSESSTRGRACGESSLLSLPSDGELSACLWICVRGCDCRDRPRGA